MGAVPLPVNPTEQKPAAIELPVQQVALASDRSCVRFLPSPRCQHWQLVDSGKAYQTSKVHRWRLGR